ncbi:MAG TPA: DNA alkylation repair protein [Candidatus Acidoferrales bacterium]|nr:DNA alkylation repair protein [Candidatus Acidoferrales bacterium]
MQHAGDLKRAPVIVAKFALLLRVRRELRRLADPSKASAMQAYMKSSMPYLGVSAPVLRRSYQSLFREIELNTHQIWRAMVAELWRGAKYREERYAAIALTGIKGAAEFQTPAAMPLYEKMIVTGAWWDYVDEIAANRVGPILHNYPAPMKKKMLAWSKCENIWKRRTSILCQLRFKQDTDLDLLYACIEPSLDSKEFFLRKAIGWALRQYAWTDPREIRRYVREQKGRLSGLSQREALKNIGT